MSRSNTFKSELWREDLAELLEEKPELYEVGTAPSVLQAIKENA